jgi:signal transduction histidine kinase
LHTSSVSTYELLEDLLAWSKSQQGLIRCQPAEFDVKNMLIEIVGLLNTAREKKSIQLQLLVENDLKLKTDYRLLFQVVQNYASNAIKYTARNGMITINAKAENEIVCISVADTGIGIPQAKLANIFELDCDFSRPGTEDEKSSGMGLILCKEYARILNAEIEVSSEIGKGSVFSICLPQKN